MNGILSRREKIEICRKKLYFFKYLSRFFILDLVSTKYFSVFLLQVVPEAPMSNFSGKSPEVFCRDAKKLRFLEKNGFFYYFSRFFILDLISTKYLSVLLLQVVPEPPVSNFSDKSPEVFCRDLSNEEKRPPHTNTPLVTPRVKYRKVLEVESIVEVSSCPQHYFLTL